MPQSKFTPDQALELAAAFEVHQVEYLFFGKSAAILLGYPAITQDVDLFLPKDRDNGARVIRALESLGFQISTDIRTKMLHHADFVRLKDGPFDLDLIYSPDGIASYEKAKERCIVQDQFPVANLRDIIASKRASNREKDLIDLPLLEEFRREYDRLHSPRLRTASEKALSKPGPAAKKKPRSD
jgi:hypothetical protein